MNRRLVQIALLGLSLGAAVAFAISHTPPPATSGNAESEGKGKAPVGGPFALVDQTGKSVTDQTYRGRFLLVFFGYTYCPDICPAGLQIMSAALDKLGPLADRVVPIFITIDPERDTPAKLAEYVVSFSPRLVGLTGSPAELSKVAKAYRVYAKKVPDERAPGDYTMDHTSILYLMNPAGDFVSHFTHTTSVDVLAEQVGKAIKAAR